MLLRKLLGVSMLSTCSPGTNVRKTRGTSSEGNSKVKLVPAGRKRMAEGVDFPLSGSRIYRVAG